MKSHSLIKHEEVASTCTSPGIYEHWECKVCNKLFKDSDGTIIITKADTIKPTIPHSWDEGYQVDKDNHWQVCTVCGASSEREKHDIRWASDKVYHWKHCAICGLELSEKEVHDFVISGDTKYCTVCSHTEISQNTDSSFDVSLINPLPTGVIEVKHDESSDVWNLTLKSTNPESSPEHYSWYVDGVKQEGEDGITFSFTPPRGETYGIMCIFWNTAGYGSASETIRK